MERSLFPGPPSFGLMPSQISGLSGGLTFLRKLSLSPSHGQGRGPPVCSQDSSVPSITVFSHRGSEQDPGAGCLGSSPGPAALLFCDLDKWLTSVCASVSSYVTWKPISEGQMH